MKLIKRYNRLTVWNKIGFFGALASFFGIVLTIIFFYYSSDESKVISNANSINFKIGYYSGRAIWSSVGGLGVFCIHDELTQCKKYIELLDGASANSDMNPDFFFNELKSTPDIYRYISIAVVDSLEFYVTRKSLKRNISTILSANNSKLIKEGLLENLSDRIADISSDIISDAGQVCRDKNNLTDILAYILIGGQIAHIEQLLIMGAADGNPNKIIPECRRILRILIEPISPEHQKIQTILASMLSDYHMIYERRDNLSYNDFVDIVGKIKNKFIQSSILTK